MLVVLDAPRAVDGIVTRLRSLDEDRRASLRRRTQRAHDLVPRSVGRAWLLAETDLVQGAPGAALDVLSGALAAGDVSDEVEEWFGAWDTLALLRAVSGDVDGAISLFRRIREHGVVSRIEQWRPATPRAWGATSAAPAGRVASSSSAASSDLRPGRRRPGHHPDRRRQVTRVRASTTPTDRGCDRRRCSGAGRRGHSHWSHWPVWGRTMKQVGQVERANSGSPRARRARWRRLATSEVRVARPPPSGMAAPMRW